jgi:hypothetical protein
MTGETSPTALETTYHTLIKDLEKRINELEHTIINSVLGISSNENLKIAYGEWQDVVVLPGSSEISIPVPWQEKHVFFTLGFKPETWDIYFQGSYPNNVSLGTGRIQSATDQVIDIYWISIGR